MSWPFPHTIPLAIQWRIEREALRLGLADRRAGGHLGDHVGGHVRRLVREYLARPHAGFLAEAALTASAPARRAIGERAGRDPAALAAHDDTWTEGRE